MSKIEEMIKRLCPNGVERAFLTNIASILYGYPFEASLFTENDKYIPLIRIRDILSGTPSTFYIGDYSDEYIIKEGDMLVGMDGNFNLRKWKSRNGLLCQRTCKIESKDESVVLNNYLYQILVPLFKRIEDNTPSGSVKHLSARTINNISIPLPPLTIQREIVSVLDSFTMLIDKMKQEVELRKKQMEYYREKLLLFDEEIRKLSFGKDFTLKARIGWQGLTKKEYLPDGEFKLITGTDFTTNNTIDFDHCVYVSKERYEQDPYIQIKEDDVLITKDGTLGKIAYISELPMPATLNGGVFVVRGKTGEVTQRFLKHYLISNNFKNWIEQNHTAGSIMHLTQKLLEKFNIPVPSPSTQEDIVSTLDAFEQYISKLERLITLREKQYAYYREKLLTFE